MSPGSRRTLPGRRAVVLLLLAHLLAVMALAASPRLHHWAHPDEDADDGDCAVVLFLHAGLGPALAPLFLAAPLLLLAAVVLRTARRAAWVASVFSRGRIFEHGPPARG